MITFWIQSSNTRALSALLCVLTLTSVMRLHSKTWDVGPTRSYTRPSQVSSLVGRGDTVNIDAASYVSDVARWTASHLLIRCTDGKARLESGGAVFGSKAIWVISGDSCTVENIVFLDARCPDKNGAGIRLEGHSLNVRSCLFQNNEDGILCGALHPSTVVIENSEFDHNGNGDGYSHNLYIGNVDSLIFRFNYSHRAHVGHELKSRANVNVISYNRITNEDGDASRNIDIPNGGSLLLIGNLIQQGPNTQNSNMIGYGLEGLSNTAPHQVIALNNTIINNRSGGSFFQLQNGTAQFASVNNLIVGSGSFVSSDNSRENDIRATLFVNARDSIRFSNESLYDYHLLEGSCAIDAGINQPKVFGQSIAIPFEYQHPAASTMRCIQGATDVGACEFCSTASEVYESQATYALPLRRVSKTEFVINLNPGERIDFQLWSINGLNLSDLIINNRIDLSSQPVGLYLLYNATTRQSTLLNTAY